MCLIPIISSSVFHLPSTAQVLFVFIYLIYLCCGQSACDGTTYLNVTRTKQYLSTPFYGKGNYPSNMNCYFVMKADPENRIVVEILEVDMEAQLFRSCLDYIGFHDGNQARLTRPYLSFCGQLRNRQVTSQSDSLTIHFISDELVEGRGVKLSYEAVSFGECDIGWLSREDGMCYRHVEAQPKVGWADAQEQCGQMQANLASIRDQSDYDYMSKSFGHTPSHSWIGYTDADHEGTLLGVNRKLNTIWPQPILQGNNDERDCLYLDYSLSDQEPYRIADCRTKQTFICQKRNNWSTMVVGSQHERVRAGSKTTTSSYTIWPLVLVALILLVILLCILCQAFLKKQYQNRVHSTESNRLVRGLDIQSELGQPQPKDAPNAQVNYEAPTPAFKSQKMVQLSPVQADVHVNPAETAVLPTLVDEPDPQSSEARVQDKEKEQVSTSNVRATSALPPRSLPPLSIREATMHSINTREESFLHSKQTSELFDRPKMNVLENVSAISLDEFWSNTKS